ncbi:MAG: hypothetical protein EBT39_02655, partial [Sphingobacteriia bacterium]|nr:hypothetical protein [Candidatus Fonsibacter lacus]
KSYTLLESPNSPPKVAYSKCHIDKNSDNQMIFKVYIGEAEGETPIVFFYECNLYLQKWLWYPGKFWLFTKRFGYPGSSQGYRQYEF